MNDLNAQNPAEQAPDEQRVFDAGLPYSDLFSPADRLLYMREFDLAGNQTYDPDFIFYNEVARRQSWLRWAELREARGVDVVQRMDNQMRAQHELAAPGIADRALRRLIAERNSGRNVIDLDRKRKDQR